MSQLLDKICVKCGRDVAHEKRVKDLQGRYYCAACYEKALQAAKSSPEDAGEAGGSDREDDLDLAPAPAAPARAAPVAVVAAGSRRSVEMQTASANISRKPLGVGGGPTCPCCQEELGVGQKICVGCGIQVPSGRPVITSLGRDLDSLYGNAETIISWISWLVGLGLYPIASEAYAIKKPIVTWAVAILTTITSIGFYVAYQAHPESQSVTQLMLWPKAQGQGDEEVMRLYQELRDSEAGELIRELANDKDQDWAKKPEKERIIAVCRALGIAEADGDFRWYQLLTNTFLHDPGSFLGLVFHLGGNMLFLLIFGTRVNALVGNLKMVILYPLLGVLASVAHLMFTQHDMAVPALGASGAIMGLAGMYLIFFPIHRVYMAFWLRPFWFRPPWIKIWAMRGFWVLGFYIAFDVVGTLLRSQDGVAHWAHLGGFIAGGAIAILLLVSRMQDARHADLLSVMLGKGAWPLIGKPDRMVRCEVVG